MSSLRPLVPPVVVALVRSQGRLSFGVCPRFFVALLLGFLWLVPAWWSPRIIAALILWDVLVLLAFATDLSRLPPARELEARRTWEHPTSLAAASEVALTVRHFVSTSVRSFF